MEALLECPLCLAPFDDPRLLPCAHTLCLKCVQELMSTGNPAGKKCPMDRTDLPASLVPETLPKNYLCAAMLETIAKEKSSPAAAAASAFPALTLPSSSSSSSKQTMCDCGDRPATVWCAVCGDLCDECSSTLHSRPTFKSHSVVDQKDKKLHAAVPSCQKHTHNKTDLYCPQCAVLVCYLCERSGHGSHGCLAIDDAAAIAKDKLKKAVAPFTARKGKLERKVAKLTADIDADNKHMAALEAELASLRAKVAGAEEEKDAYAAQLGKVDDTYRSLVKTIEDTNAADVLDRSHMRQMEEVFRKLYKSLYAEELSSRAPCLLDMSTVNTALTFSDGNLTVSSQSGWSSAVGSATTGSPFSWKFKIKSITDGTSSSAGDNIRIGVSSPGELAPLRRNDHLFGTDAVNHVGFHRACEGNGVLSGHYFHFCRGWQVGDVVGVAFDEGVLSFVHDGVVVKSVPFSKPDWVPVISLRCATVTLVTDD